MLWHTKKCPMWAISSNFSFHAPLVSYSDQNFRLARDRKDILVRLSMGDSLADPDDVLFQFGL